MNEDSLFIGIKNSYSAQEVDGDCNWWDFSVFTINELIKYLNFRNVGLRKYLWYANFEE